MRREVWKKVPGLPWYYEVSNLGRLRRLAHRDQRGWFIKTKVLKCKRAEFYAVMEDGERKWCALAGCVLLAFVGPPKPHQRCARHLDDDRSNNKPTNLAWGTDQENHDDATRNGRTYVSYGHLGKPHSEKTKALISKRFKGIPTGRRMSQQHHKAITDGFRRMFPTKPQYLCNCGCGELAAKGKKFLHGHHMKLKSKVLHGQL